MAEIHPADTDRSPARAGYPRTRITIAVIISILIIILACLASCTALGLVFLYNAPWQ